LAGEHGRAERGRGVIGGLFGIEKGTLYVAGGMGRHPPKTPPGVVAGRSRLTRPKKPAFASAAIASGWEEGISGSSKAEFQVKVSSYIQSSHYRDGNPIIGTNSPRRGCTRPVSPPSHYPLPHPATPPPCHPLPPCYPASLTTPHPLPPRQPPTLPSLLPLSHSLAIPPISLPPPPACGLRGSLLLASSGLLLLSGDPMGHRSFDSGA